MWVCCVRECFVKVRFCVCVVGRENQRNVFYCL